MGPGDPGSPPEPAGARVSMGGAGKAEILNAIPRPWFLGQAACRGLVGSEKVPTCGMASLR